MTPLMQAGTNSEKERNTAVIWIITKKEKKKEYSNEMNLFHFSVAGSFHKNFKWKEK